MSNQTPLVCVVLVNWNGWQDTQRCLDSLFNGNYQNFRVIVCDNASTDGSVEHLEAWAADRHISHEIIDPDTLAIARDQAPQSRLLLVPTGGNPGFAAACNIGLRHVMACRDYAYVWLLNNDTVVDRQALADMLQDACRDAHDRPVGSAVYDMDHRDRLQVYGGQRLGIGPLISPRHSQGKGPIDYLVGASILMSRKRLENLGLMNENFFLNAEDLVYTLDYQRAFRKKHPGVDPFLIAGRLWHRESSSQGRNKFLHTYYYSRNILLVARSEGLLSFACTGIHALLRIIKASCLLRFSTARGIATGIIHALYGRQGAYKGKVD